MRTEATSGGFGTMMAMAMAKPTKAAKTKGGKAAAKEGARGLMKRLAEGAREAKRHAKEATARNMPEEEELRWTREAAWLKSQVESEEDVESIVELGQMLANAVVVAEPEGTEEVQEEVAQESTTIEWPNPGEVFWNRPPRTRKPKRGKGIPPKDGSPLQIVHIAAEMAPLAKVGGLGDVVTGLAKACEVRGHRAEVVLPYYECIKEDQVEDIHHVMDFDVPKGTMWDGQMRVEGLKTSLYEGSVEGVKVLLLRPDWNCTNLFRGQQIYGGSYNELEAYLYFCRASLEMLKVTGRQPDILHLHEWQCAAAAMLYWEVYHLEGLWKPRVMLTIHNLANSGDCRPEEMIAMGLDAERFRTIDKALDERTIGHNPERLSLLKGGIVYSSAVTTVSPTYRRESLESGAAGWLQSSLLKHQDKYHGILNGIDDVVWDPADDPFIPVNYTPTSALEAKATCKKYVQRGLGLAEDLDRPLVCCITRLVPQKGIHLIRHAIWRTIEQGGQFVLLGSGHADGDFRAMAEGELKNHSHAKLLVMYSEQLSHYLYAASDCFLVPSMFEPCGLTQMVAMKYGSLPIVRRTGGLADTVIDVDQDPQNGNGYVFDGADEGSLDQALDRALNGYRNQRDTWSEKVKQVMDINNSWDNSAQSYIGLYRSLLS